MANTVELTLAGSSRFQRTLFEQPIEVDLQSRLNLPDQVSKNKYIASLSIVWRIP